MLAFAAEQLASQLRKMDFLSRSANDEFLIILPTASQKFAEEIVQRIRDSLCDESILGFRNRRSEGLAQFRYGPHFGRMVKPASSFSRHARVRKQQAKAEEPSKILWFPKEYVN